MIIGFDPGRDKCGLALVQKTGTIIEHQVVNSEQALMMIQQWCEEESIQTLVMGNQTTSQQWRETLQGAFPNLPILMVDERNSTLEARDRYWEYYPPRGLMRLLPKGMRIPPRPIDDIVAILLVERSKLTSEKTGYLRNTPTSKEQRTKNKN
ncbi:Resolvase RNase H domain protein fold protein [Halothece sp. PCC 7418]|uniref:pre-16S rRNA-processing nuclease YqgF n=1 Tax=Halothece sp. (strain PCC 7418) TaxID=65093 RepID=UPI0002A06EBE|nr:pre-16S rRNA-processing nuclease YqgF [Halothece sp. PCC 7418]AFZ43397.1 Resolvase RNase H domain protein fold protein [Halothece sp. PCC 7418]